MRKAAISNLRLSPENAGNRENREQGRADADGRPSRPRGIFVVSGSRGISEDVIGRSTAAALQQVAPSRIRIIKLQGDSAHPKKE